MSETPFNITQLIMSPKTTLENLDDVDSDSDDELPFMQAVTKEELRLSRVEKRAQKKAEKHGKAEVFRRMVRAYSNLHLLILCSRAFVTGR